MPAEVTISILQYKNCTDTLTCLESLYGSRQRVEFQTLVCDNGSGDASADEIHRRFPQVTVIQNARNVGFSRGHNLMAKQGIHTPYVLFLNNDTLIFDHALDGGVEYMEQNPKAGLLGAKNISSKDGSPLPSCYLDPNPWDDFFKTLRLYPLFSRCGLPHQDLPGWNPEWVRSVPAVIGSFLFMRKSLFDTLAGFDPAFFLYYEELDLARRIRRQGYKIYYVPSIQIVHFGSQSLEHSPLRKERDRIRLESKHHLFRKHYGILLNEGLELFNAFASLLWWTLLWTLSPGGIIPPREPSGPIKSNKIERLRAFYTSSLGYYTQRK